MEQKKEKIKKYISKNFKWIIFAICIIVFTAIAEDVFEKEIMKKDIIGYYLISKYLISDTLTPIVKVITNLTGTIPLIIITAILIVVIKNKKIAIAIALNPIIALIFNQTLKFIVKRPRPLENQLITESGYSFPSGHSMVSMAFYGFLIYLVYHYIKNKKKKIALISVLSILIFLIGTSRIYLGVHYTSDVIAGFAFSIAYLIVYTTIFKQIMGEKENDKENKENNK